MLWETKRVDVDQLKPHPENYNHGEIDGIGSSLGRFGMYRSVAFQKSTGFLLAGNQTWQAAKRQGFREVLATEVDCDDDTARAILAADNRWSQLATTDTEALHDLLETLSNLTGTGYTDADIADLAKLVEPPDLESLAESLPQPQADDNWPTISVKVPRHVAAAWRSHTDTHGGNEAAAMASLLGVDPHWDDEPPE